MADQLRFDGLSKTKPTSFSLEPEAARMKEMASDLGILGLRKLRFEGTIKPVGKADWALNAHLGATVIQSCVVTLEPVTTRIEEPVDRYFSADWQAPEDAEVELAEDDDETDPVPEVLDLLDLAREALSLALPPYPRHPDAEIEQAQFAEGGVEPMSDEAAKPFAGLADLKKKLEGGS